MTSPHSRGKVATCGAILVSQIFVTSLILPRNSLTRSRNSSAFVDTQCAWSAASKAATAAPNSATTSRKVPCTHAFSSPTTLPFPTTNISAT
ncbi:hypothetical protein [Jonesia denitrificans]|uniref:hypothetical protein n=1 Tax=Jonesia denitrificans TaxID=43674 RepID=UPI00019BC7B2|nr:hypothetical protein [Jonesia denitrificans]ASE08668.1 hypothetical protein CEP80_05635 [Jonesia denitrificans]QXB43274.1 hypothetical protein I6L70_12445 [Jonesia denitrificans]